MYKISFRYCHLEQNTAACEFDGGDCRDCLYTFLIDGDKHECCYEHWSADECDEYNESGCIQKWFGDEFCDFENNFERCSFDGGDCEEFNESGCIQAWIKDGLCDPELNNELCDFDGGDCLK